MSIKHIIKRTKIALSAILLSGAITAALPANVQAISASVSMSATPSMVSTGNNTVVTIYVNAGADQTDGGEVLVNFDAAKLQYTSVDYAGSPLATDSPNYASGAGYVVISRYTPAPPGPSSTFLLARLTFKALVQSGSSAVTIDQSASYFSDHATSTDSAPTSVSGVTITFQAPPATPTTPTTPSTPATGSGGSTGTSKAAIPTKPSGSKTSTTTPTAGTEVLTPSDTTPAPTTPDGQPIPAAAPVSKSKLKIDPKFYYIAGGTLAIVLLTSGVLSMLRRRHFGAVVGGSSHTIINTASAPLPPENPNLSKIPSVETKAPGEVVQPQSTDHTQTPVG